MKKICFALLVSFTFIAEQINGDSELAKPLVMTPQVAEAMEKIPELCLKISSKTNEILLKINRERALSEESLQEVEEIERMVKEIESLVTLLPYEHKKTMEDQFANLNDFITTIKRLVNSYQKKAAKA